MLNPIPSVSLTPIDSAPDADIAQITLSANAVQNLDRIADKLLNRNVISGEPITPEDQDLIRDAVNASVGSSTITRIEHWRLAEESSLLSIISNPPPAENDSAFLVRMIALGLAEFELRYPHFGRLLQRMRPITAPNGCMPFAISCRSYYAVTTPTPVLVVRMTKRLLQAAADQEESEEVALEALAAAETMGLRALLPAGSINLVLPGFFLFAARSAENLNPVIHRLPVFEPLPAYDDGQPGNRSS